MGPDAMILVFCVSCIAGRFFAHWATGEACERFSFLLINNNLLAFR